MTEEQQATAELKAMSREELDRVPFDIVHWQCKIKLCKCYKRLRDYGLGNITGEFWHRSWGWLKIWPTQENGYRELFFCGKHHKRYKAALKAGDWDNVPLKKLKNGGVPWGWDETKTPNIVY